MTALENSRHDTELKELREALSRATTEREKYRELYMKLLERCRMLERGIVAGQKAERFTGEDDGQLSMQLLGMLLSGEEPAAIRHLCRSLPASEHRVVYLCDCAVKPLDLYRMLAAELGLKPSPRAQIVSDIKAALVCRLALFAGFCPTIKAGFRGRDARRAWGLEVQ